MKADGFKVARCTVERLMKQYSLQGVWRGKGKITTKSRDDQQRADDLVNRDFTAHRPNQLWVADFTYIKTLSGWVYTVFIIDVFARCIVGWKVSNRMNTDMVMSALNQAIADRNNPKDVIHHSDRGVQYLSIRYTDKIGGAVQPLDYVKRQVASRQMRILFADELGYSVTQLWAHRPNLTKPIAAFLLKLNNMLRATLP